MHCVLLNYRIYFTLISIKESSTFKYDSLCWSIFSNVYWNSSICMDIPIFYDLFNDLWSRSYKSFYYHRNFLEIFCESRWVEVIIFCITCLASIGISYGLGYTNLSFFENFAKRL